MLQHNRHCFQCVQAELDEAVLRKLARTAAASLNPMAAMFGGVVGQEVRHSCCWKLPMPAAAGLFGCLFAVNPCAMALLARSGF